VGRSPQGGLPGYPTEILIQVTDCDASMIVIILPDFAVEDRLLAQARSGNDQAIQQIYEVYFSPIYNFIRLRVEDRAVAEDLASEVFIRLVTACRGRNAPHHRLRGWLFKVARNLVHDHYGKARKITTEALEEWMPDDDQPELEVQFIRSLDIQRARQALQQLSGEQQEVLLLRFGQSLSLQETADIMGKQIGAIKSLQFRAVTALRNILGDSQRAANYG
jgi:RNA polymerase sigma-70 factor, ECF subfamily